MYADLPPQLRVSQAAKILCVEVPTIKRNFQIFEEGERTRIYSDKYVESLVNYHPEQYVRTADIIAAATYRRTTPESFAQALLAALNDKPEYISAATRLKIFGRSVGQLDLPHVTVLSKLYYLRADLVALLASLAHREGTAPQELFDDLCKGSRTLTNGAGATKRFGVPSSRLHIAAAESNVPHIRIPGTRAKSREDRAAWFFLFPKDT